MNRLTAEPQVIRSPTREDAPSGSTESRHEPWLDLLLRDRAQLTAYANRIVGSRFDAEDVVEDVVLRILLQPRSVRMRITAGYVVKAVRNAALNLRRAQLKHEASLAIYAQMHGSTFIDHATQTDYPQLDAAVAVLAGLPARRRKVFWAVRLERCTYKQVASRFGMSVRAVEREIHLGLEIHSPSNGRGCLREGTSLP